MPTLIRLTLALLLFGFIQTTYADHLVIQMHLTAKTGVGKPIGTLSASDTQYGLLIIPNLQGLPSGLHGFHIHQKASCARAGLAAGGHYDPKKTHKHLGPYNPNGHLGDLPALFVNQKGQAELPILAPRLTVADIKGHAIIIHLHGDNYSDYPAKLGGGGARIACGIIPETPTPVTQTDQSKP